MPQIQMLEGVPSFGTQLAQNLGQGFNKGLEKGIASGLSGMLARKKEAKSVRTDIGKLVKQYEKGTFDPKTIQGFENRALELLNEGKVSSSLEATLAALVEFGQKKTENQPKAEVAGKEIASAKASPTQIPLNFLKEPKPQGFWNRVLQGTGQGAAMQAHALEQQREAIPQLAAGGIEGATLGFAKPLQPETEAGKLYRETGKLAGLGKTYGKIQQGIEKIAKPTSLLGKIATGSAAGATISSAQQLIEKGEIDPKQLGIDTAIWTGLEGLFVAAPQVMRYLKGSVETIAKETGKPAEEILNEAVKSSGADFEKVLTGDAKEINKISKDLTGEAEAVSKKVEKAPKEFFEPEKAIKHREKTAQKLPGSPLEEYFSVEKPITKRAETVVKETEMISKFQPLEKQMNTRLQAERDELRELMADRRGLEGNALERVNTNIIFKQRQIDKTLKDLKDLRYELKYFRKPPSEAEIESQIKKSGEEIAKEAANPTEKGQKDIQRQLELDKKYLEKASKLSERGELPGEIRPDVFIKMKQKYLDGYNALIKEQRELVRELKGSRDSESLKRLNDTRNFISYLENRIPRLKSDIVNQTDKIKAMNALSGPPGAFYKQQLRTLKPEVEAFQKDFFRHLKLKNVEPLAKTEKVAQRTLKEAEKVGEEVGKSPTKENINKASEVLGEKPENLKSEIDSFGKKLEERAKNLKDGKATEGDITKTTNEVRRIGGHWERRLKTLPKNLASGFGIGLISGMLEEHFGIKLPAGLIGAALPFGGFGRIGGGFAASYAHRLVSDFYNEKEAKNLKSFRNKPDEYTKHVRNLRSRYKEARVNKIIKESMSVESS